MAKKTKKEKEQEEKIIREVRDRLRQAQEAEADNREQSISDARFENGDQWDEDAKREREEDGRPCITINKTAATVKQIIGEMRQNKLAIKVRPVDSMADPQTAEILTGLIRNIENISHAEDAYDYAAECAIRGAFGYFRILTDYSRNDVFDQDILVKRIVNPYSVYFDPAATEADCSDARWCIITQPMEKAEFEANYPGKSASNQFELLDGESDASWFAEDTVTIAEYWIVEQETKRLLLLNDGRTVDAADLGDQLFALESLGGIVRERETTCPKVTWYKVSGGEVLEGPKEWAGQWIPIIPVFGEEIWLEGKKHLRSAIRWAKDPNRLYNWARSNAVETLALAPKQPFLATPDQVEGHEDQWEMAHRRPQSYLLYNNDGSGPPQRQPLGITDTGANQESMMSADDVKSTTGHFDASLGASGNEKSGIAIRERKVQSNTSTFIFTDNLRRSLLHAGRIIVDLIPKIYDTERVVRLLNEDGSEGWERINQTDPVTGRKINDLSVGKYDVKIDVGPAYGTKRQEAAEGMVQMTQAAPQTAQVILPRLAKNLDWPEADDIAEELKALFQPQQPPPDPRAEAQAQKMQFDMQKGMEDMKRAMAEMQMKMQSQQIENEGKELENVGKQLDNVQKQVELSGMNQEMVGMVQQMVLATLQQAGYIR